MALPKPAVVAENAALRREVDSLRARVRQLEKKGRSFDRIVALLVGTGKDESEELGLIRIAKMAAWELIVERGVMRDLGTYEADRLYGKGATITHNGALWTAQLECKGVRPGEGSSWRMLHKTEQAELRRMVREEVQRQAKGQADGARTTS